MPRRKSRPSALLLSANLDCMESREGYKIIELEQ